jgi:hypothetical protein
MPACNLCKPESMPCICLGCNRSGPYMQETPLTPPRMDYESALSFLALGGIVKTYSVYSV